MSSFKYKREEVETAMLKLIMSGNVSGPTGVVI